jgi:hypothetical protein
MKISKIVIVWAVAGMGLAHVGARAELPPSAYEAKQKAAPESLSIEVVRVDIEPGTEPGQQIVNAIVIVTKVERTATGLEPEALITLSYPVTQRPPGFVGPGEIPILTEGEKTIAYLAKNEEDGTYAPVAGIMSFSNF